MKMIVRNLKCTVSNKSLCHMKFHNLDSLVFLLQQPKDSPLLEKADKVSHAHSDPVKVNPSCFVDATLLISTIVLLVT